MSRGYVYLPKYTDKDGNTKQSSIYWIGYSVRGTKYKESAKTESKREAEQLLAERLADRAGAPIAATAEKTTFEDLCELIRNDYKRNGHSSKQRLERSIHHLEKMFSGWSAAAIDEAAADKYISMRLDEGYAPATINRELSALKRMLRLGYKVRKVRRVPDISSLKEDNARKGFFSEEDIGKLRRHLPAELVPLVETAFVTGWRKAELLSRDKRHCNLPTGDVANNRKGWLRLEPGESKNSEGRMFPITDRLRVVLEKHERKRVELQSEMERIIQPLFFRYDGPYKGERIRNFHKQWSSALEAAGLEERIFHDLRRSSVKRLVSSGVPQAVAKKLTGHKTDSVFNRYAIVDEGMLREAGDKLEARVRLPPGPLDKTPTTR